MNIAVILSGGKGTRMNMSGSKQLLKLNGKEIFLYSTDFFSESDIIDEIVVVYNPEYEDDFRKLVSGRKYHLVECGDERWESSFKALRFINENFPECEKVFIHDGARPFPDRNIMTVLADECSSNIASVPGIPLKDTVKQIDNEGYVINTPDRNSLVCVQTPQAFDFRTLYDFYEKTDFAVVKVTDDASVWEFHGKKVRIVPGSPENIKVTTREDLDIAKNILDKKISEKEYRR